MLPMLLTKYDTTMEVDYVTMGTTDTNYAVAGNILFYLVYDSRPLLLPHFLLTNQLPGVDVTVCNVLTL